MNKAGFFKISRDHVITLFLVTLIIASLALSVFFYDNVPDKMATHWDSQENPDGFSSKEVGLFIFPALLGLVAVIYLLIPSIDPLKKNILKFEKEFGTFLILLSAFFIVIQAQVISWNLGVQVSPSVISSIGIGVILFYAGILLKHAKRNFFISIRTPWTLSSNTVWDKTHKIGSILFRVAAVFCILSILFIKQTTWIVLGSVLSASLITIIYSYILYSKEEKQLKTSKKVTKKKVIAKKDSR